MSRMQTGEVVVSSDVEQVKECINRSRQLFYTYLLRRANRQPFYVGKGCFYRVFAHEATARDTTKASHKLNLLRKMQREGETVIYEIDGFFGDEASSFARENILIKELGRYDLGAGPLLNSTDGGEGLCNPSEEVKRRWRMAWSGTEGQSDRARLNRYFQSLFKTSAVPLKPLNDYPGLDRLNIRPQKTIGFTDRQAATLVASMHMNCICAAPGCHIPRRLTVDGISAVIENGAGNDILTSGMAVLLAPVLPGNEVFVLTPGGFDYVVRSLGRQYLESLGISVI